MPIGRTVVIKGPTAVRQGRTVVLKGPTAVHQGRTLVLSSRSMVVLSYVNKNPTSNCTADGLSGRQVAAVVTYLGVPDVGYDTSKTRRPSAASVPVSEC